MQDQTIKEFSGKKILFLVENLPSPFDRRVWQEANALSEQGAIVSIICPTGKGFEKKFEIINNIYIYRYNLFFEANKSLGYIFEYSIALLSTFYLTLKCLFTKGFDVIHACNPPDLFFLIAIPFKIIGKKFIFDHHDLNPELYLAKFNRYDFFYKMLVIFEKLTFKLSDISIATNNSYKNIAINRGKKKPEDVFVVRSGPSLESFKKTDSNFYLKKGRKFLVGYIGVMGKQEGINYLIDAVSYIVNKKMRMDIHFICVGGGTELEALKNYAKEKGCDDYITFTGRISDEELLIALTTCDICVNPDEFNEMNDKSTMNKIMEYMALGKPIVQFDLLEGRYSAQAASLYAKRNDYADFAEKIIFLINNPLMQKKMGEFGFNRMQNELEWKYQKEILYDAYRKVFTTPLIK